MKVYSNEHEWALIDGEYATIGISHYAVEQLGDITFVELPEENAMVTKDESAAFIESVKAASEVYSPLSGMVSAINEALDDAPELVNESPEEQGWIYKIKISNPEEITTLMNEAAYADFTASLEG